MWCGSLESGAFAPCCLFALSIVCWAIAAIGARALSGDDLSRSNTVLMIIIIAVVLISIISTADVSIAAILSAVMAVHAIVIAIATWFHVTARPHPKHEPARTPPHLLRH